MRRLHPDPTEQIDPAEAYAYPADAGPWLRANMVTSVDGAATVEGTARGLSSPADRRLLQLLRGLADVVLVGASTVRRERYGAASPRDEWQPLRRAAGQVTAAPAIAVVSRSLDLDPDTPLFTQTQPGAGTIVFTTDSAPAERRRLLEKAADVIVAGEHEVDLGQAVDELVSRGHTRLLTEGGPHLLAEVIHSARLDELCLTLSPLVTAGGAQRIVSGDAFPQPARLRLAHILEEDHHLFLRYVRGS